MRASERAKARKSEKLNSPPSPASIPLPGPSFLLQSPRHDDGIPTKNKLTFFAFFFLEQSPRRNDDIPRPLPAPNRAPGGNLNPSPKVQGDCLLLSSRSSTLCSARSARRPAPSRVFLLRKFWADSLPTSLLDISILLLPLSFSFFSLLPPSSLHFLPSLSPSLLFFFLFPSPSFPPPLCPLSFSPSPVVGSSWTE